MIGIFPSLYPDELLYSAFSRFASRMRIRNGSTLVRTLLSDSTAHLGVTIPAYLDAFLSAIPQVRDLTAEDVIAHHSMASFYAPFLPSARVREIKALMRGSDATQIRRKVGVYTPPLALRFLRYCPDCVRRDRAEFGETYWHRVHQIPGLAVCTLHSVWLVDSDVPAGHVGRQAITAEERADDRASIGLPASDEYRSLLELARSAEYLLGLPCLGVDVTRLADAYRDLLFERGLLIYPDILRATPLRERITGHHGASLLSRVGAMVSNSLWSWPNRILGPGAARHPIYHLVFLAALEIPIASLFPGSATGHTEERGDESLTISARAVRRDFETRFRDLWNDPQLTHKEIARRLDVSRHHVRRLAIRMGLSPVRQTQSVTWLAVSTVGASDRRSVSQAEARNHYRERWLQAIKMHPDATRKKLIALEPRAYNWLFRHDREWYEDVSPPPWNYRPGTPPRNDWSALDDQLTKKARCVADELAHRDPPVQVTKAAILRGIGLKGWRDCYKLRFMTKLSATLTELREPIDVFYPRKVRWAASMIGAAGNRVTPTSIQRLLGATRERWSSPALQAVVAEVCHR